MTSSFTPHSRRTFLANISRLSLLGAAAPFAHPLAAAGAEGTQSGNGYKALVCIFLEGGCDNWNALPPFDTGNHDRYFNARPEIALSRSELGATVLKPTNNLNGFQFALNPQLAPLCELFHAGDLAVVQNVGNLVEPTTKAQYEEESVRLPPQLFSHNDQRALFLSSISEGGATGWGGRIADKFLAANQYREFTCISASGRTPFLFGNATSSYAVGKNGAVSLLKGIDNVFGSTSFEDSLRALSSMKSGNSFEQEYASLLVRSLDASTIMNQALSHVKQNSLPELAHLDTEVSAQLASVARVIGSASSLGMRRQVFFVNMRGWDTHGGSGRPQHELFGNLAEAMDGFWKTMQRLGVSNNVTTFTASDFGRTLASNRNGSDHGWGGAHFVMGGAVNGGKIYGKSPLAGLNTENVIGSGRLIPTTSTDQYAATFAKWFGLDDMELPSITPNLVNFKREDWDLGFLD